MVQRAAASRGCGHHAWLTCLLCCARQASVFDGSTDDALLALGYDDDADIITEEHKRGTLQPALQARAEGRRAL